MEPDWKKPPRIKDAAAMRRKVRRDQSCRACGQRGSDAHHILYRSLGGDDVEDNIVCLCRRDHMVIHFDATEEASAIRAEIGKHLTAHEIGYVTAKRGDTEGREYLLRYYAVPVDDPRYSFPVKTHRHPKGAANLRAIADL